MKIIIGGRIRATLRDAKTGRVLRRTRWKHNLVPDVGLYAFARRFINEGALSNEGIVYYGAVGSGNSTPSVSDTVMENETARKTFATQTRTNNSIKFEVFFTTAEGNGTITKFAMFGEDATASADTGTMFEHLTFDTPIVKTADETLTIEIDFTFSRS